jgi:hypothetical protein
MTETDSIGSVIFLSLKQTSFLILRIDHSAATQPTNTNQSFCSHGPIRPSFLVSWAYTTSRWNVIENSILKKQMQDFYWTYEKEKTDLQFEIFSEVLLHVALFQNTEK